MAEETANFDMRLIGRTELCERLGIGLTTLHRHLNTGRLPAPTQSGWPGPLALEHSLEVLGERAATNAEAFMS